MINKFRGTGVALVTPFNADGSIDYPALEALVKHVSDGGVDYLVVLGTTGESPTLTITEKLEVLRFVNLKNLKKLPVMYGMGGNNTMTQVEAFKAFDEEVDAFLVVCPFYNKPTQVGLKAHFEALADAAPQPIMMYNVPKRTGVNMEAATVLELAKHPNIFGIKEAAGDDVSQASEIAAGMPNDFLLATGDDDLILPFIKAGGYGVISVIANALPKETSSMVNHALKGAEEDAETINTKIESLIGLIFEEGNPSGIKSLLEVIGIGQSNLRLPLVPASTKLAGKIKKAGLPYRK
ncbi:MAG: 4-hydroxy-tetrahydrodipicolinate synthase [Reichenbachiella sp.]